jgi:hypothetical protein
MRDDAGNTLLHLLEKDVHIKYLLKVIDVHETNIFGQTALWSTPKQRNFIPLD